MKRFTILLLSLMTLGMYAQDPNPISISTNFGEEGIYASDYTYGTDCPVGQTLLFSAAHYDKETNAITGVWTAGETEADKATYKVIDNPEPDGINNNAKCLEVTCHNTDGSIGINFSTFLGYKPFLQGRRRISMLFKAGPGMETNFYAKMQLETNYGTDGVQKYALGAYYDATTDNTVDARHDGWKRLYFDFTPYNQPDNNYHNSYHDFAIGEYPDQLVFTPKRYAVEIGPDGREITKKGDKITFSGESVETFTGVVHCKDGDVYYIDDIRIEDLPYAEGKPFSEWTNGFNKDTKVWTPENCDLPKLANGVLRLSGTWLKGMNLVNPEIWEKEVEDLTRITTYWPWNYEFNEYRDLSWHVNSNTVKLMVFKNDSQLRWPDRGGLMGHNSESESGYPEWLIRNYNVLIFAEKSCVRPDEGNNLDAHWHDINAVIHYKDGDIHYNGATGDIWEAWELELTDEYGFVNPLQFTALNLIKAHRSMKAGFNALIYPFELTPAELKCARVGTVYHHRDPGTGGLLYFVPAPKTQPNVPYLTEYLAFREEDATSKVADNYQEFKNDNHIVYPVQEDYRYSNNASKGILYGNYQKDFSGVGKWGLVTDGTWQGFRRGVDGAKFKSFRGYLDELPAADVSGARMLSIFDADDTDVTGIETPGLPFKAETLKTIYDMQGRVIKGSSIATLSKGIYIINGKKTIIK